MSKTTPIFKGERIPLFIRLLCNGFAQAGLMVITAYLIKLTFDQYMLDSSGIKTSSIAMLTLALLASVIFLAILRLYERVDAERMGQSYIHHVRVSLFSHISRLPARELHRRSRGGVLLRFIGDLTALRQWVSLGVARLSVATVMTTATLIALAFINLSLASVVAIALTFGIVLSLCVGSWLQRSVREARRRRSKMAANVSEKVGAISVVQAYGQSERERTYLNKQSHQLVSAMINRARAIGTLRGLVEFTSGLATVAALILGVLLVNKGAGTPGTVVAAISIVGLLTPALRDLGRVQEYWHGAKVSQEKITDFMMMPVLEEDEDSGHTLPPGTGQIIFEKIYTANSLNNFNAKASGGQIIGIVGPNGAGKSTLLSLAARMLDPEKGHITLDGKDIRHISLNSLREAVGIVSPDLPLLRGSIEKNIRYRMPNAESEAVSHVMKLCGIDLFIDDLPKGINTRLREGASNLSLGQRQRIMIARALLGNPRLLLLDEIDANLDPKAGEALRRVLTEYQGTIMIVTHRLDWLFMANCIWHIDQGELIESGPPERLLKSQGPTAQLFTKPRLVANGNSHA